jgi:hypothetical protein
VRSILTVTTAASSYDLTTLERVKEELGITGSSDDARLSRLITASSAAVATYLNRVLAREIVSETIRFDDYECREEIVLQRSPIAAVTSAAEDGTTVDSDEYEIDADSGIIYRLDAAGYRYVWFACKSLVVVYSAGWVLPGNSGANLPAEIEQAAIAAFRGMYFSTSRDPMLKAEEVPGVQRLEYWVGQSQSATAGPAPEVLALIAPYRRIYA